MATTFKTLLPADVVETRNRLHEAIPVTGTIASGTYSDSNIKNHAHGMFQSVYDYPYLSSSANHIFDLTAGYATDSAVASSATTNQLAIKNNLYNQMAQVLVGHDADGNIRKFDEDGNLTSGDKLEETYFINFARLLTKDEIKKGSFNLQMYLSGNSPVGSATARLNLASIQDLNGATTYKVNSPAGEYGVLYTGSVATGSAAVGLVYYQAGVAVLTASIFDAGVAGNTQAAMLASTYTGSAELLASGTVENVADALRHRLHNVSFNNTTELNSTVYFCRANANEFNYSSNPTYLTGSQIRVKNVAGDEPVSYITTVGLYSADNELLAVGKVSEPIKKTPSNSLTLRVRTDW